MNWEELLTRYLQELQGYHRAHSYLRMERFSLEKFRDFCQGRELMFVEQVQPKHLTAYMISLQRRMASDLARYGSFATVRRWLKWATRRGYLLENPAANWEPRHPSKLTFRVVPTETQMLALLEKPDLETFFGQRDQVLLEFLYGTGLRLNECANVNVTDVDLHAAVLTVRVAKGGAVRYIPLGPKLTAKIREYLINTRPHLAKKTATGLFVNDIGGSMRSYGITVRLQAYTAKTFNVHSIRHAYATHLLLGGAPLWAVQRLLGHKSLTCTQIYTRMLPLDVQREVQRTHPRAKAQGKEPPLPPAPTED